MVLNTVAQVHYVNDTDRGVVWEEVIIMLPGACLRRDFPMLWAQLCDLAVFLHRRRACVHGLLVRNDSEHRGVLGVDWAHETTPCTRDQHTQTASAVETSRVSGRRPVCGAFPLRSRRSGTPCLV